MPPAGTRKKPTLIVDDIAGVSSSVSPVELVKEEDPYLSQSELSPNARYCSEVLNDLLYKIHRQKLTNNEINKLRTQLENNVTIR